MPLIRAARTRQPNQYTRIDWGNPLTRGLLGAFVPGVRVNIVDGVPLTTVGFGAPNIGPGPRGREVQSNAQGYPAPSASTSPEAKFDTQTCTALAVCRQSSATNSGATFGRYNGSASPTWAIGLHGGSVNGPHAVIGNYTYSQGQDLVVTNPNVVAITGDGSTAVVYANGRQVGTSSYTTTTPEYNPGSARQVYFGPINGGFSNLNTFPSLCLFWNRPLSASEIAQISANPWQVFVAQDKRWPYFADGGAGTHDATGALSNAGGSLSGTASSATSRNATGALAGAGATTSGTAARTRAHPSSGVLANPGGQLTGSAARAAAGNHPSVGVLSNPGAVTTGAAARVGNRPSSGVLQGAGGQLSGSANRVAAPVTHVATGVLANPGASLVGFAINESGAIVDTHDGFWFREQRKMWEWARKKKPTIEEVVEYVEDEPEEALEIAKQVAPVAVSRIDTTELRNNTQAAEFVAQQLMVAIELRRVQVEREADEDDIESILLLI